MRQVLVPRLEPVLGLAHERAPGAHHQLVSPLGDRGLGARSAEQGDQGDERHAGSQRTRGQRRRERQPRPMAPNSVVRLPQQRREEERQPRGDRPRRAEHDAWVYGPASAAVVRAAAASGDAAGADRARLMVAHAPQPASAVRITAPGNVERIARLKPDTWPSGARRDSRSSGPCAPGSRERVCVDLGGRQACRPPPPSAERGWNAAHTTVIAARGAARRNAARALAPSNSIA